MQCGNCGAKNPRKNKFCKECGQELVAKPKASPSAAPQGPTVVIVEKEKQRRGGPRWFVWLLIAIILLVLLCCLLLWLRVVPLPCDALARLPAPVIQWIQPLLLNMGADCFEQQDRTVRPPGMIPQVAQDDGQDEPEEADEPAWQPPPEEPEDACEDPWIGWEILEDYSVRHEAYSGQSKIEFVFEDASFEDLVIVEVFNESGEMASSDFCSTQDNVICPLDDDWNSPLDWDRGQVTFVFSYEASGCYLGEFWIPFDCPSGQEYYDGWPYNGGCCTVGCYCQDPGTGQWGCWQTCASSCQD